MKFPFFGEKFSKPKFSDKEMQLSAPEKKTGDKAKLFKPEIKEVGEFSPERKKFTDEMLNNLYEMAEFVRDRITTHEVDTYFASKAFLTIVEIAAREKEFALANAATDRINGLELNTSLILQRARLVMVRAGLKEYFSEVKMSVDGLSRSFNGPELRARIFSEMAEFTGNIKYLKDAIEDAGEIEDPREKISAYSFIASKGNEEAMKLAIENLSRDYLTPIREILTGRVLDSDALNFDDIFINIIKGTVKLGKVDVAEEYLGKIKDPIVKINGMVELGKLSSGYLSGALMLAKDEFEKIKEIMTMRPSSFLRSLSSCFIDICEVTGPNRREIFFDSLRCALDILDKTYVPEQQVVAYAKLVSMLASHNIDIGDFDLKEIKQMISDKLKNQHIFKKPKNIVPDNKSAPGKPESEDSHAENYKGMDLENELDLDEEIE